MNRYMNAVISFDQMFEDEIRKAVREEINAQTYEGSPLVRAMANHVVQNISENKGLFSELIKAVKGQLYAP